MTASIPFGIQLHPQCVSWDEMREFGLLVDRLGYDNLMTWDHFVPLVGDASGPNLEGWQVLAAYALPTRPLPGVPTVEAVAQRLAEHWRAGVRGFVFGMRPPYDREVAAFSRIIRSTIERLTGEVKPRVEQLVS